MSLDEIKQKYARRYEMYLKLVRELRHTVAEDEDSEDLITLDKEDLVEMRKWLIALNSLDTYIQNHREGNGERTLRGKQVNVFEDLRNFLEAGGKNGYVKLPTGFGKTVLFIEFIEALNLRSLIVVPTKLLISQTEVKLKKFAPDLEAGKVYQKAKEFGRQVTIITYDSLMSKLKDGSLNPNDYDCVILDEVHQALGEQSRKAIEQFTGGIKIGFTATPDFSAEKGVKDLLGIEIHRMSIREGVESGHLCSFANRLVRTEADISNVKTRGKELDEAQLAEAVDIASRNEMAIRIYKERFDGELAVAYCVGVRHAKKLAELFCQVGVAATVIHGKMNDKERESIIEQYDNGEIKVLCNADLLVEGFDEPRASVCFNLRPVKSGVMAEQRGGRVMRLDETNPNKLAYIFDFVDKGTDESDIVLFAKVADGAFIANPNSDWGKLGKRKRDDVGDDSPDFEIEGIEVIFDEEEILRIQQNLNMPEKELKVYDRTLESAAIELEGAFSIWKKIPEKARGKFNTQWLLDNGYRYLYVWARGYGGFDLLLSKTSLEFQKYFEKREQGEELGVESASVELEAAYKKWKDLLEKGRGKFNVSWLLNNGYIKLYRWLRSHGGIKMFVAKASFELQRDFEKRVQVPKRSLKSTLLEFEDAYKKWKDVHEEKQEEFNAKWIIKNGHSGMYAWATTHGGLDALVARASPELQRDFVKKVNQYS